MRLLTFSSVRRSLRVACYRSSRPVRSRLPLVTEWSQRGCTVTYSEGVLIGQRRFDALGMVPLFPFGHGLGY